MARRKTDISKNGLLCVKSIMTIALTVMLCILVYLYPDSYAETFKSCIVMVVTFYFTHQMQKEGEQNENAEQRKTEAALSKRQEFNCALAAEEETESEQRQ